MKKIVLSTIAMVALALTSYGQGVITLDASSSSGVVDLNGSAASVDLNVSLLYFNGTSYADIVDLLLSDVSPTSAINVGVPPTTTQAAGGDITAFGSGVLYDNSGDTYQISTAGAGSVVSFEVEAWTGNYSSYAAAFASAQIGEFAGISSAFNETLSAAASPINASLDTMPTFNLTQVPVPEPATLALAGLGGLSVLLFRRRA